MNESLTRVTARTATWSAIQKFSSMGIGFIVTMLLARLLDPSDYGAVALLGVFFALAGSFSECGFRNALIRKDVCTQADYSTAFYYNVGVSVIMYAVLYLCAPFIANFYEMPILCSITRVSGISLLIGSINLTQSVQLTRNLDFKNLAIISAVTGIASGILGVVAAYLGMGVWALVIQGLSSTALNTVTLIFLVRWRPTFEFSKDSFGYLWNFGSKMLLTGLISTLYANIYSIVIGKFYNASALGLYNRGERSSNLFPDIIGSIFTANTLPILSQLRNNHERMIDVYRKYVILTSFLNIPACLILVALAQPFILFFLTDKWSGAIIYIQIFCIAAMLGPAGVINLIVFQVEGRSDITLKLEVIKKVIGFSIVFILSRYSPLVLAIGSSVYSFFAYFLNLYYVNKLEKLSYTQQICDIMPCFISGVISAIAAYMCTCLDIANISQLLIGGAVGGLSYFAITKYVFKMEIYGQLYSLLKSRFA